MKRFTYFCLLCALSVPVLPVCAQDRAQEKSKSEERAKPSVLVKVQVLFTEYDGDKKVSSMPYTFSVIVDDLTRGPNGTNLRTGVRIPITIEVDGKDQKTQYLDIGSNIDCGVRSEEDGRFRVTLNFDRSGLFPNKSAEGERLVSEPNGQPLVRQFRMNQNVVLKDGQTSDSTMATDPINGHTMRVALTINVLK